MTDLLLLSSSVADFALRLLEGHGKAEDNLALSPWSLLLALSSVMLGADGRTYRELKEVLLGANRDRLDRATLCSLLKLLSGQLPVTCVNTMFTTTKLLPAFTDALVRRLDYQCHSVDKLDAKKVNQFVAQHTSNAIPRLLEDEFTPEDRLVIVNALHFHGAWKVPFQPRNTEKGKFRLRSGQTVSCDMMNARMKKTRVVKGREFSALWLPYAADCKKSEQRQLAAVVVLPMEHSVQSRETKQSPTRPPPVRCSNIPLVKICQRFNGSSDIEDDVDGMELTEGVVEVTLPKFDLVGGQQSLALLKKLGVHDLFSPAEADLSHMTCGDDLYISKIAHQARITVNEHGTTASAATAVVAATKGRCQIQEFVVDRPFAFFIVEPESGLTLFAAIVNRPS